ncbi:MAG: NAD(P)/FAD-dependent oxidoreductase [Spirochaetales bacterium]|nr:NAD(P)/FAD-dependent oxidoreductase [Spirochaetales bacterium]
MGEKSIAVVGAGIAGLAAGCYARMNGFAARVYEAGGKPGGLCTAWRRGDYLFDGCVHRLMGCRPPHVFNRVWRELGAFGERPVIDHEIFRTFVDETGRAVCFYANAERLREHLCALSPADRAEASALCGAIVKMTRFDFGFDARNLASSMAFGARMLTLAPVFQEYGNLTLGELGARFQDPLVGEAVAGVLGDPDIPAIALATTLSGMHAKTTGFPAGGSLALARSIEKRLLGLGGTVEYGARVTRILAEGGRARGVELEDGRREEADAVISAADGRTTIFDLLEGRYAPEKVKRYYGDLPIFRPLVQVSLGVNMDLAEEPHSVKYGLKEPIDIAGEKRSVFGYAHYSFDPSFAPAGKSVIACLFPSDFAYWESLASQGTGEYDREKDGILRTVIAELDKRLPGLASKVEESDVATPLTFHRYTGNRQGSPEGWRLSKKTIGFMMTGMETSFRGLKNFRMAGHWVKPGGGLPPAAVSGREAVAALCRRGFRTTTL